MKKQLIFLLLLLSMSLTLIATAQEITPKPTDEINPDANITFPPPVYVLRGEVELMGSANLENMTNYFVEFRPLEFPEAEDEDTEETENQGAASSEQDDESTTGQRPRNAQDDEDAPWFPVTLPDNEPVVEGSLGLWNTETTEDGLYEIRLSVNVSGERPTTFIVSPLRIENEGENVVEGDLAPLPTLPPPTSTQAARPTLIPTPTEDLTTPMVTANLTANVRTGDGTNYPAVGTLGNGQSARIIGISSRGTGWFFIELGNGDRVWIAPSVVTVSGDTSNLPRINPPPTPTPAATATPVATATPIASANLAGALPSLTPNPPQCGQNFTVNINLTNNGTTRTNVDSTVTIQDLHIATNTVQNSLSRNLPPLDPGANFVVTADLVVSTFFNEAHRIVVTIDSGGIIPETNESDNVVSVDYTLGPGNCGQASANLSAGVPALNPNPPVCNQPFTISVTVSNTGGAPTGAAASVTIRDVHVATNGVQVSDVQTVPALEAGASATITSTLNVSTFFNEQHRIEVVLDTGSAIAESNKGDNITSVTYTLAQGACS